MCSIFGKAPGNGRNKGVRPASGEGAREANVATWQIALLLLVIAWFLQSIGVWLQMRHYQRTFRALHARWNDGTMGAGAAPSRFGQGVIALVVVAPDQQVRAVSAMRGRSFFASFKDRPEFDGMSLGELKQFAGSPKVDKGLGTAIGKAIEQIEKVLDGQRDVPVQSSVA